MAQLCWRNRGLRNMEYDEKRPKSSQVFSRDQHEPKFKCRQLSLVFVIMLDF